AGLGAAGRDPAAAFGRRTDADDLHVLPLECLVQVGEVGDAQRPGEPFVQVAAAAVDVLLVGDGDEPAARVRGEGGGVVLLVRVATGDQQDAVRGRIHEGPL